MISNMEKKIIQVPAQITSLRPLVDKSASVTLHTKELAPEEFLVLLEHNNKAGWFLFKDDEEAFSASDVPKDDSGFEDGKSPSERLYNVLFVFWNQNSKLKQDYPVFGEYYRAQMEKIINQFKSKLI